jgi:hypothetical protein
MQRMEFTLFAARPAVASEGRALLAAADYPE